MVAPKNRITNSNSPLSSHFYQVFKLKKGQVGIVTCHEQFLKCTGNCNLLGYIDGVILVFALLKALSV